MKLKTSLAILSVFFLGLPGVVLGQSEARGTPPRAKFAEAWTGDFDGMVKRRVVRMLVVQNKTHFFLDKGAQRGMSYEFGKAFEDEFNKKLKTGNLRIHVVFIPVAREELLPSLIEGRGDIAAANLMVTPEREKQVDFCATGLEGINEIIVSGPGAQAVASLAELGGKEVFVRKASSGHESLVALNDSLRKQGKPEVLIKSAPDALEDEDLLEMLNAGLIKLLVVDDQLARFWAQVLPDVRLHPDLAVRTGGSIGPAIRKNSPLLMAELDSFLKTHGKGTAFGNIVLQKYLKNTKFVKNAASEAEMKKFGAMVDLFRKYGGQYKLDWLLMAAQAYQESQLNQGAQSAVGAIGVMQLMPATGKEMNVGDINELEANIHAGVKYIRWVIDNYFKNEPMDDINKGLFAFASYNAGPGRVRQLRAEAKKQGLDPNVWFNNVEQVAAARIGRETVQYVSNIYKYYVAYKLVVGEIEERAKAREEIK